ncbi:hypothetical protein [Halorubrum tropicale]|jgi:uncharacterized membrane protein YjdF|uniref:Uncharacterized protein n=1 Tax=Halorubrum tropicale TaxID=1765655 RepID=A0A0N0UAQ5_9EURY|nr:hypothetical protein [Halorubrum tropicale]KOX97110.1 hypothetical protein AMR74_06710 [Halorubrum tropicale]
MTRLRSALAPDRADAVAAWAVTAGLVAAVGRFLLVGEPDWAAFTALLALVAVVVPVATRDPAVTVPAELLAAAAVPVAVRAAGALPGATPFVAAAALGLLVAVVLDAFTSLSMTPRFAAVFVVVATMAAAGAWAVGSWVLDAVAGTSFVGTADELMWDLIVATAVGVGAGVLFDVYCHVSGRIERLRPDADAADADRAVGGDAGSGARLVGALQAVLLGIAAIAVARGDATLLVNSAVPLGITLVPALLRRQYGYAMDARLVAWIAGASTLHAVGALALYGAFGWYDSLAHTFSAGLVAGAGYALARSVERHSDAVAFTREFRATFVVLFVLAVGVAWEVLEFASGGLAAVTGGEAVLAQYGTTDIVNDLAFNTVGAVLVAAFASAHFEGLAARLAGRVGALVGGGD